MESMLKVLGMICYWGSVLMEVLSGCFLVKEIGGMLVVGSKVDKVWLKGWGKGFSNRCIRGEILGEWQLAIMGMGFKQLLGK